MIGSSLFVTYQQLPQGYSRTLGSPPNQPVTARPAATLALLRGRGGTVEVLLLKRSPAARFIPGAFVFPGGRVDVEDGSREMEPFLSEPNPIEAKALLGENPDLPPAHAFWVAALRETFEEAGILLGEGEEGVCSFPLGEGEGIGGLRRDLHSGNRSFPSILGAMGRGLNGGSLRYIGHWMTPTQERYRYDTRSFGAEVPPDCQAFPDGIEMVEAVWLTPEEALHRNKAGVLPMVFPTILTLEDLLPFRSPREALEELGRRPIQRLLPMVEDTGRGVKMVLTRGP